MRGSPVEAFRCRNKRRMREKARSERELEEQGVHEVVDLGGLSSTRADECDWLWNEKIHALRKNGLGSFSRDSSCISPPVAALYL